ncbi:MAG: hypothetical protein ABJA98_23690 [Acidobacteriota bacterium]
MKAALQGDECGSGMPFREKLAWFALVTMAIASSAFFLAVLRLAPEEQTLVRVLVLFTVALTVQGVIMGVGRPLLARGDPAEAKAPPDERDRAVAHRATSTAYVVLMIEVWVLAMGLPFVSAGWRLTVALLLAMVLADAVRYGAIIAHYRLRWHG